MISATMPSLSGRSSSQVPWDGHFVVCVKRHVRGRHGLNRVQLPMARGRVWAAERGIKDR
jgi:hypothetical protein